MGYQRVTVRSSSKLFVDRGPNQLFRLSSQILRKMCISSDFSFIRIGKEISWKSFLFCSLCFHYRKQEEDFENLEKV